MEKLGKEAMGCIEERKLEKSDSPSLRLSVLESRSEELSVFGVLGSGENEGRVGGGLGVDI